MCTVFSCIYSYDLKIGLIASTEPEYIPTFGLGTSIGAVGLVLDRIQREQLLPNVNIRQASLEDGN